MDSNKNDKQFFAQLPLLESFFEASNPSNFSPLPDDWFVAVTDIEDSTVAVNNGQYKSVNILGASSIVGLLNMTNKDEIPFTFGGDGCAICIPPELYEKTKTVLASSQQIGKSAYGLNLRAAIIPISTIRDSGYDVLVAKYKVSEVYAQATFMGGGLSYAEDMLKSPGSESFAVNGNDHDKETDFTGLECRWQEVGREGNKVITILAKANPDTNDSEKVYNELLTEMNKTFKFDDQTNPISSSRLKMNMSLKKLMGEVKFRTFGLNWMQRLLYVLKLELQIIVGKIFMALNYKSSVTDWSLYKQDLALNSDNRKFDDMLRLVISGTEEQCEELERFLRRQFEDSKLAYGIHVTDTAMITCMVFEYQREHIHFVDGSNGGYVEASKMLKQQLKHLS